MLRSTSDDELDENKIDFDLLNLRRQSRSDVSSDSTILSDNSSPQTDEIWPLHLTPKFIDHYVTGDLIGSGSYAEVRECVDMRTLERCALKIINKEHLIRRAPRALANQLQEIRILRHFHHANIIGMRECLHKGSFIYMALEYCSFNLNELLNDQPSGKFNVVLARRFFHQLCFGIQHLHTLGIIHRDIKPDNLLLTNSGTLKIIDFGVSHILSVWSRDDWCSNYEGTPLFQAPEVISGQVEYRGFKVDIWSCGITLFLMLFGTYPFMDEALLGLYDKILSQDLEVPSGEPTTVALTDLLASMLDRDCTRRASIDEVLEHPWIKLCQANLNDSDDAECGEFFDLVLSQGQCQRSRPKDVYRSMTVLPYLYRYHFPELPIRKSRGRSGSPASRYHSHYKVERLNSISPPPNGECVSSKQSSEGSSCERKGSPLACNCHSQDGTKSASTNSKTTSIRSDQGGNMKDFEDCDELNQIEWGTEEQYQLMKVPQVRANRAQQLSLRRPRPRRRGRFKKGSGRRLPTSG